MTEETTAPEGQMFALKCQLGADPADGLDTYLITLYNADGELVGASGYVQSDTTDSFCSEGPVFISYLLNYPGQVYIGQLTEQAQALVAALADQPVLWEDEVEGDWVDNTDPSDEVP